MPDVCFQWTNRANKPPGAEVESRPRLGLEMSFLARDPCPATTADWASRAGNRGQIKEMPANTSPRIQKVMARKGGKSFLIHLDKCCGWVRAVS